MSTDTKPAAMTDEHTEFLDELRESGVTNMFGARPYLMRAFPDLAGHEASAILSHWMATFGDRRAA